MIMYAQEYAEKHGYVNSVRTNGNDQAFDREPFCNLQQAGFDDSRQKTGKGGGADIFYLQKTSRRTHTFSFSGSVFTDLEKR